MRTTLFTGLSPQSMRARVNSQRKLVPEIFMRLKDLLVGNEQQSSGIRSNPQEKDRNVVANYHKSQKVTEKHGILSNSEGAVVKGRENKGLQ